MAKVKGGIGWLLLLTGMGKVPAQSLMCHRPTSWEGSAGAGLSRERGPQLGEEQGQRLGGDGVVPPCEGKAGTARQGWDLGLHLHPGRPQPQSQQLGEVTQRPRAKLLLGTGQGQGQRGQSRW